MQIYRLLTNPGAHRQVQQWRGQMERLAKVGLVPIEAATETNGLTFLQRLQDGSYPSPPYAATSDIDLTEVERGRVVFEGRPSARFYNPLGTVHGGWTSGLLDSAMGCAVHSILEPGQA